MTIKEEKGDLYEALPRIELNHPGGANLVQDAVTAIPAPNRVARLDQVIHPACW